MQLNVMRHLALSVFQLVLLTHLKLQMKLANTGNCMAIQQNSTSISKTPTQIKDQRIFLFTPSHGA